MGELGETFRVMTELRRAVRTYYGRPCEECLKARPKGQAKILLPGQTCGYGHKDTRPKITRAQYREIEEPLGIIRHDNHSRRR